MYMAPNPLHLETYPRRAFVAALGLAPQVVTETLWALAVRQNWLPTEIHLITTMAGKARAEAVLTGATGSIAALAADIGVPDLALAPIKLHLIGGAAASDDIDSELDNMKAADLFAAVIGALANDQDCAIHVSIAGGRKTMGFLAGYALSLFGRAQDRLSHVLVPLAFQNLAGFHFPPKVPRIFMDANGQTVTSAEGDLVLADIPFVRMRASQTLAFLGGEISFSTAVKQMQDGLRPPMIEIDENNRIFACMAINVALTPANFAFAAWLAQRGKLHGEDKAGVRWNDPVFDELAAVHSRMGLNPPPADGDFIDAAYFRERISRIKQAIKHALGSNAAPYLPLSYGKPPLK